MLLYLLLFIIIVIAGYYYYSSKPGGMELIQNKTLLKGKQYRLGYANFESFISKKKLDSRLICVIGAKSSGSKYLANLISKKYGHKVISQDGKDTPQIRKEFYIENVDYSDKTNSKLRIKGELKKKYVIEGIFDDKELSRLFKGKGYNRNFILIFVEPKQGMGLKWSKLTGRPREEYEDMIKESKKILENITNYRVYILQNNFSD